MQTALSKYVVVNEHTLCHRQHGSEMLGVLSGSIHGRDWRNGPILLSHGDVVQPATEVDFSRLRCMLPSDFDRDAGADGYRLTVVEMTVREFAGFKAANDAFQTELVRVYGAKEARAARHLPAHEDGAVQAARDAYEAASDVWRSAIDVAQKVVIDHDAAAAR